MTTLNDVKNKNVYMEPEHSEGTRDGSLPPLCPQYDKISSLSEGEKKYLKQEVLLP